MIGTLQWRRREWARRKPAVPDPAHVGFTCNLCGTRNSVPPSALQREVRSCVRCGSTVRTRTMGHLVTSELLGRCACLATMPRHKHLRGVGLSDVRACARPLGRVFDYTNTFLHRRPRLDIGDIGEEHAGRYDFLIASDVFEHVTPPVARAFANARRMLKPAGAFVFSVPYELAGDTIEHFPDLGDYRLVHADGRWRMEDRTPDGVARSFTDLVFHGGPGSTLEMRVFSLEGLRRDFADAGFQDVRIADESCVEHGIHWSEGWSLPIVARATGVAPVARVAPAAHVSRPGIGNPDPLGACAIDDIAMTLGDDPWR